MSMANGDASRGPAYSATNTPQAVRTATLSHPQLQQRQSFNASHPAQFPQQHSASPAPFQPQQTPNSGAGFQPPALTPHGSFQGPTGHAQGQTHQFANYTTPQSYQPRPVQPNYQALQQQPPPQYGGPTGAASSMAPTPIGGPAGGMRGYNAPPAPEVYCLADAANAIIPEDVRRQFHCDDHGRVLFFTAPPVEVGKPHTLSMEDLGATHKHDGEITSAQRSVFKLGHSARYLAAKTKRDELISQKRKRDAEDAEAQAPQRRRTESEDEIQARQDLSTAIGRAVDTLEQQLAASTRAAAGNIANGSETRQQLWREVDLLEGRWAVAQQRDRLSVLKRDARAARERNGLQIVDTET